MITYNEVLKPHEKHFETHKNPNCHQCMKYLDMKQALENDYK